MSQPSEHVDLVALSLLPGRLLAARRRAAARGPSARRHPRTGDRGMPAADAARGGRAPIAGRRGPRARRGAGPRARAVERRRVPGRARRDRRSAAGALGARKPGRALRGRPSRSSARARASPYGLSVAERLAADLAARGIVVVSGLARGVDSAAHRGALAANGSTLAVLGSGADVMYPRGAPRPRAPHRGRRRGAERARARHAAAQAVLPAAQSCHQRALARRAHRRSRGEERVAHHGPVRSRAGTRRAGRARQRALRPESRRACACCGTGQRLWSLRTISLEELSVRVPGRPAPASLTGPEDLVLRSLPAGEACDLDAIADRTGLPSPRLLPRLFELEMQGLVRRVGGGRFVRV